MGQLRAHAVRSDGGAMIFELSRGHEKNIRRASRLDAEWGGDFESAGW